MRIKTIFGREPALWLALMAAALNLIVAFGVVGLTSVQAGLIVAAVNAVGMAVAALLVRPIAPAAVTGAVTAIGALVAGFGFEVPPEQLAAVSALVLPLLALVARGQVTPVEA